MVPSSTMLCRVVFSVLAFVLGVLSGMPLLAANPAIFDQTYRPQYHFSPAKNWTNDPNGLVYFEGEYHLFFQYNPFGDEWGHMSWGHAISRDLLRWDELPVALPEENGVMIFTGSTVVDEHNSSSFCQGGKPCLVAIYTGHTPKGRAGQALQTQNVAYSNDRGRNWTKYSGNPVLNLNMADFRDPKAFWSTGSKQWVMVVSFPNEHRVRIYGSPNLKHWSLLSEFGPAGATAGQWECPELFEVPVESEAYKTRWVLKVGLNPGARLGGSGEQYFVGSFDGKRFSNDNPSSLTLWTDYGKDCYCALTFNGLPTGSAPTMIGWMDNWQYASKLPTSPWRGQMTFPRKLSLRRTELGIRLVQEPVSLAKLAGKTFEVKDRTALELPGHSFVVNSSLALGAAREAGWRVLSNGTNYTEIGYDQRKQVLYIDRRRSGNISLSPTFAARIEAPLRLKGGSLKLQILVDRSSVEVFANGGEITSTNLVFPPAEAKQVQFYSTGGLPGKATAHVTEIRSAHLQ